VLAHPHEKHPRFHRRPIVGISVGREARRRLRWHLACAILTVQRDQFRHGFERIERPVVLAQSNWCPSLFIGAPLSCSTFVRCPSLSLALLHLPLSLPARPPLLSPALAIFILPGSSTILVTDRARRPPPILTFKDKFSAGNFSTIDSGRVGSGGSFSFASLLTSRVLRRPATWLVGWLALPRSQYLI
jgi:hypothetical protein